MSLCSKLHVPSFPMLSCFSPLKVFTDACVICTLSPTMREFACSPQRQSLTFPVSSAIKALVKRMLFPYCVWISWGFWVSRTSALTLTFFIPCRRFWINVDSDAGFCLSTCLRILSVSNQLSKLMFSLARNSLATRNCATTILPSVIRKIGWSFAMPRYLTVRSPQADFPFSLAETKAW